MWLLKYYLRSFSLRYAPVKGLRSKCMGVARPCFRERNVGTRKLREGCGDGEPTSTCTETSYRPRDPTTVPLSPNPSRRSQFLAKLGKGWNLPAADPRQGKQLACLRQPCGQPGGFTAGAGKWDPFGVRHRCAVSWRVGEVDVTLTAEGARQVSTQVLSGTELKARPQTGMERHPGAVGFAIHGQRYERKNLVGRIIMLMNNPKMCGLQSHLTFNAAISRLIYAWLFFYFIFFFCLIISKQKRQSPLKERFSLKVPEFSWSD